MKRWFVGALGLALLAGGFGAGSWYGRHHAAPSDAPGGRKILYYVDPMNPAHTSDKPGLAPCGMKMEPIYADQAADPASDSRPANPVPGTVRLTSEKQQLIGVLVGTVEKKSCPYALRLLGRVAADETRVYKINAAVGGWITKAPPIPTWSQVKRDEVLGQMFSPEFRPAAQALLFALDAKNRSDATERAEEEHEPAEVNEAQRRARAARVSQFKLNIQQYVDSLKNLGMAEPQVQEMIRTHTFTENFEILAPADGFITLRNISAGQRFERGEELFRIADLSRVWVLADLFENDAQAIKPGTQAQVTLPHQQRTFLATVSGTLPEFNAASRTLKVRLELDNPEFVLRPDMFVDVEFPLTTSEQVMVPAAAVLDAGLRKVVFVEREKGVFAPRQIETGRQFGDQVQVFQGLTAGERIAVSGNFLLDSESRMKLAAAGGQESSAPEPADGMTVDDQKAKAAMSRMAAAPDDQSARDPVCGMTVNQDEARAAHRFKAYMVQTYYFCSDACQQTFEKNPARYVENAMHGYRLAAPADMESKRPSESGAMEPTSRP